LQNRLIQTSQTGGQQYSVTSPFSIPCLFPTLVCAYCLRALADTVLTQCPTKK
jgi:hypothetical protein